MSRAASAMQINNPTLAIATLTPWLQKHPDDSAVWVELSSAHSRAGQYRQARLAAVSAAGARLTDVHCIAPVAFRLRAFNESALIRSLCTSPLVAASDDAQTLSDLAAILSSVGDQPFALSLLDRAVRRQPHNPRFRFNRAQVLSYFGRTEDAERDLEVCLGASPAFSRAHWLRSRLRRQSPSNNHTATLRGLLTDGTRPAADIAFLGFALHKELDDLGRYEQAWVALTQACAAKRKTLSYPVEDTEAMFDFLYSLPPQPRSDTSVDDTAPLPVFIVGMHRSGTSLLERMLAGHSQIAATGELYDFPAQLRLASDHHGRGPLDIAVASRLIDTNFAAIGRNYLDATHWRRGDKRIFTDKLPSNFVNLWFIARALPQARILHMVRNPLDTALSNLRELFSDACPYSYDQRELADYYLRYRHLMQHWHDMLPGRIVDVRYENLVTDPQTTIDGVLRFLGVEHEPGCTRIEQREGAVATASSARVHGAIDRASVGSWERYAGHLRPLMDRLGEAGRR